MAQTDSETNGKSFWRRTFSSLKHRNFRLLWLGSVTEHAGERLEMMALSWLMMRLTERPLYLGLMSVSRSAATILFSLVGGVVADRVDRRNLLIVALLGNALISIVLVFLDYTKLVAPWHLFLAAALTSVLMGFNHPARATIVPNVVPREELTNAIALDTASVRLAGPIVPLIGGYLIAQFGTVALFAIRAVGALLAIGWLVMVRVPATPPDARRQSPWQSLWGGLKYAAATGLVLTLLVLLAMRQLEQQVFSVFLPFFATDVLHAGAVGFGYLNSASAIGSLLALLVVASLGNFKYKGRLIVAAGILIGLFLSGFGLSQGLILSLILLAAVSFFATTLDNVSQAVLQTIISDEFRGRVMSLRGVMRGVFGIGAAYLLGVGGEYLGIGTATVIFGLFFITIVTLVAFSLPSLRRL
ncbi:MAG: MFS transporter [Dehalococcoidales bacterium]|nr:MFS transporter [Dehalococcoidales bacterium]